LPPPSSIEILAAYIVQLAEWVIFFTLPLMGANVASLAKTEYFLQSLSFYFSRPQEVKLCLRGERRILKNDKGRIEILKTWCGAGSNSLNFHTRGAGNSLAHFQWWAWPIFAIVMETRKCPLQETGIFYSSIFVESGSVSVSREQ